MEDLIEQNYKQLSGTFRMTSGIIDGKEVPDEVQRQTVLVTDRNGTGAEGTFPIHPTNSSKEPILCKALVLMRARRSWDLRDH